MRLETIVSRVDLPSLEKELVTNFREGWGCVVGTEGVFLAGCSLLASELGMQAHLSRGTAGSEGTAGALRPW